MNWNIIKYLTSLPPRSLNITLLLAGVMGMIYISKRSEDRITVLENRLENVDRLQGVREDSLNRVFQNSLAECRTDNNVAQERFIAALSDAKLKLEQKLDERDEADQKRLSAAKNNGVIIRRNHELSKKINNTSKGIESMEN